MDKVNNLNKFLKLRIEYPFFSYDSFDINEDSKYFLITYHFNNSDKFFFNPQIKILKKNFKFVIDINDEKLKNIIFNIGLIELISYWKATCSPEIIVKPYFIDEEQISFWKKIYFNGLGEFFYLNSIETNINDFVNIKCLSEVKLKLENFKTNEKYIVPIGGGKDSVVTLNLLLKNGFDVNCFVVNQRKATSETIESAGLNNDYTLEVERKIDKTLLDLNSQGFLNGHTPFSAMLAFLSSLMVILTGQKHIVLSNESSANEPTVANTEINHQYSKSFEFENDFRNYLGKYITKNINYFSLLRPISELQIAKLFSQNKNHFKTFKSCNVGSKQDIWCCNCSKCLFTFIMLSTFIPDEEMFDIYGKNLFDDKNLQKYFDELIGISEVKPFECIGTVEEVNVALCLKIKCLDNNLPFLLDYYKNTIKYNTYKNTDFALFLNQFDSTNFLPENLINILKLALNKFIIA